METAIAIADNAALERYEITVDGEVAVLPFCPFVNAYIKRHPEYADLVPEKFRAKFDL